MESTIFIFIQYRQYLYVLFINNSILQNSLDFISQLKIYNTGFSKKKKNSFLFLSILIIEKKFISLFCKDNNN